MEPAAQREDLLRLQLHIGKRYFTRTRQFSIEDFRRELGVDGAHLLMEAVSGAKDVLEIGCGKGEAASMLADAYPRAHIVGLDYLADSVQESQRKGISVVRGDGQQLPFRDASFDVVFSVGCFQYFTDKLEGLREVARVLRPEGVAAINLPPETTRGLPEEGFRGTDVMRTGLNGLLVHKTNAGLPWSDRELAYRFPHPTHASKIVSAYKQV